MFDINPQHVRQSHILRYTPPTHTHTKKSPDNPKSLIKDSSLTRSINHQTKKSTKTPFEHNCQKKTRRHWSKSQERNEGNNFWTK